MQAFTPRPRGSLNLAAGPEDRLYSGRREKGRGPLARRRAHMLRLAGEAADAGQEASLREVHLGPRRPGTAAGSLPDHQAQAVHEVQAHARPPRQQRSAARARSASTAGESSRIATRGGYSTWIVGKNTPETPDGVSQVKLTFQVKVSPFEAMFKISFHYRGTSRRARGSSPSPRCQIEFNFQKAD